MNIIRQIAIIFGLCLLGQVIALCIPIPIPSSVISMVLLLGFLLLKWIKLSQVETVGKFLLGNMAFFFIPTGVSILENYEVMKSDLIAIISICLITTVLTFGATGLSVKAVMALQNKQKEKKDGNSN